MTLSISRVRFAVAPREQAALGLIGFVSFLVNGQIRIYGVAVRRTLDGRHVLSFPERKDDLGHSHPLVRPIDDATRREIEREVFEALGLLGEVEP
jgi:hypothetical protein